MRRWLLLWCLTVFGMTAVAAPDTLTGENSVYIDGIVIKGKAGTRDAVIRSALDLPQGVALARDQLDERLMEGHRRLEALGYFRTVDIKLRKGEKHAHYQVEVALEPETSQYAGFAYNRQLNDRFSEERSVRDSYQLFAGTRDLLGSGLRSELTLNHHLSTDRFNHAPFTFGVETRGQGAEFSLVNAQVYDSPWFIGLNLNSERFELQSVFLESRGSNTASRRFDLRSALGVIGRHFHLLSFSLGLKRYYGEGRSLAGTDDQWNYHFYLTSAEALVRYSDKTYLAIVEPGSDISLRYDRTLEPKFETASLQAKLLHTAIFGGMHAISPVVILQQMQIKTFSDDGELSLASRLARDLSVKYELVALPNLVIAASYGEMRTSYKFMVESEPNIRRQIGLTYASASIVIDFSFIYGEMGLADSAGPERFHQTQERLGQ